MLWRLARADGHSMAPRRRRWRAASHRRTPRQLAAEAAGNRGSRYERPPDRYGALRLVPARKSRTLRAPKREDRPSGADSHSPSRVWYRSILPHIKGTYSVAEPIIQVENLYKNYGAVEALRGVSFAVEEGEVFGLLGPNGAGKTSTVEILEGMRTPDSGTARVCGLDPEKSGDAVQGKDRRRAAVHCPARQAAREGSDRPLRQLLPPPRRHRRTAEALPAGRKAQRVLQPAFRRAEAAAGAGHGAGERSARSCSSTSRPPDSIRRCAAKSTTSSRS